MANNPTIKVMVRKALWARRSALVRLRLRVKMLDMGDKRDEIIRSRVSFVMTAEMFESLRVTLKFPSD